MANEDSNSVISDDKSSEIETRQYRMLEVSGTNKSGTGRSLFLFFVATFTVTWLCWIPIVAHSPMHTALGSILVLVGTFAPAIVSLALTRKHEGSAGVKTLLERMLLWQVGMRWYVLAVVYLAAIKLSAALIYRLVTSSWPRFGNDPWYLLLIATIFSTPVQSGEELGWRGYALPRLAERMGFGRASIFLGFIWAAWHLPIFYIPGADKHGQSFPVWALAVTAVSIAMTWVYVHTGGSLLLVMIMHAAADNLGGVVSAASSTVRNPFSLQTSLMLWLTTALLWVPAIYFLLRMPEKIVLLEGPNLRIRS